MIIIPSLIIAIITARCGKTFIRKHVTLCRLICLAVVALCVLLEETLQLSAAAEYATNLVIHGGLAGAFFILVMFAGALHSKSRWKMVLVPIRGELAIYASILASGHIFIYGKTQYSHLLMGDDMLPAIRISVIITIIMIALMLPCFVTSFIRIRKKMNPQRWKKLQRSSYLFYALIYLHVFFVNLPAALDGQLTHIQNIFLYSVIFLLYFGMRIRKELDRRGKQHGKFALAVSVFLAATVPLSVLLLAAVSGNLPVIDSGAADALMQETGGKDLPSGLKDGVYSGSAGGYNGNLETEVTIQDGKVVDIRLVSGNDDSPYQEDACRGVFEDILARQTTDVDAVSGATTTSKGLIKAVRKSLEKAALS